MNKKEFEQEFVAAAGKIYNLGLRLFRGQSEDASDFVQEVYLYAFDRKDKFLGKSKFSTWLYSLAMNYGLNLIRKQNKSINSDKIEISSPDKIIDHLHMSDNIQVIQEELQKLPNNYRIPLFLRYYEKMSYIEIGEQLKQKIGTVKSNVHRGKEILKNLLKEREIEL